MRRPARRAARLRSAAGWLLLAAATALGARLSRRVASSPTAHAVAGILQGLLVLYGRAIRNDGFVAATLTYWALSRALLWRHAQSAYHRRFHPPAAGTWEETWLRRSSSQDFRDRAAARISAEEARFVRRLRVDAEHGWRGVAEATGAAWHTNWGGIQEVGYILGEAAARRLGEHPDVPPWN